MKDKTLVMTFINNEGNKVNIRLDGVKEDITEGEVAAVMDLIIEKNLFLSSGGDLKSKDSAQIIEKNVSKMILR